MKGTTNYFVVPAFGQQQEEEEEEELMVFDGSRYADPVFSWEEPVGVTD